MNHAATLFAVALVLVAGCRDKLSLPSRPKTGMAMGMGAQGSGPDGFDWHGAGAGGGFDSAAYAEMLRTAVEAELAAGGDGTQAAARFAAGAQGGVPVAADGSATGSNAGGDSSADAARSAAGGGGEGTGLGTASDGDGSAEGSAGVGGGGESGNESGDSSDESGDGSASGSADGRAGGADGFGGDGAAGAPAPSPADRPVPAGTSAWPWWCDEGETREEICGNAINEDCDGQIDEDVLVGLPCSAACSAGRGTYECVSQTVACVGPDSDECPTPGGRSIGCGDRTKGGAEECDYFASGEELGVTCGRDCKRVRFPRCYFGQVTEWVDMCGEAIECRIPVLADDVREEVCERGTRCVVRIGACMPTLLGEAQPRCPEILQEPPLFCGNGKIDDGEQCDRGRTPDDCSWDCRTVVSVGDERLQPPPLPMIEIEDGDDGPVDCLVSCSEDEQCPSSLSQCYMGYCVAPF